MIIKRIFAEIIFVLHVALFFLVLFGWALPGMWYFYMTLVALTLISDLVLGYCLLSKWEFDLRRQVNPEIKYDYSWSVYYLHRFLRKHFPEDFWRRASTVFLLASFTINLYFHVIAPVML